MPEGDTVHLAAARLHAALANQTLQRGELRHPRLAEHDLRGQTVLAVRSVGKHLLVRLSSDRTLHAHFRMDGSWHIYRLGQRWRSPGHQARAILASRERVTVGFRLHDLALLPTRQEHQLIGHLGPDLLDPEWSPQHAKEAARRLGALPDRELGPALLDQRIAAGIGNLYKTEMCFLLGVSPWAPVRTVPTDEAITLARTLLLRNAERPEQSTTGSLFPGAQHWVFERAGQPCRRCGSTIRSAQQEPWPASSTGRQARISYYCPRCQPNPAG